MDDRAHQLAARAEQRQQQPKPIPVDNPADRAAIAADNRLSGLQARAHDRDAR